MRIIIFLLFVCSSSFSIAQDESMKSFVGDWVKEGENLEGLYFIEISISSDGIDLDVYPSHYGDGMYLPSTSVVRDDTIILWVDEEMQYYDAPHLLTIEPDGRLLDTFGETEIYYRKQGTPTTN